MIRRLRIQFIIIALLASFVILAGILGGINIANFVKVNDEGNQILTALLDNNGTFDMKDAPEKMEENSGANQDIPQKPQDNGKKEPPDETPFSTRFFTVTFYANGTVEAFTDKNITYTSNEAIQLASKLKTDGKSQGHYDNYLYGSKVTDDSSTLYVFVDRRDAEGNLMRFFTYSLIGGLGGFCAFAAVIAVGSYFVLRPAIESEARQKRFITDSSHSLKTPLAIIQADNEVIEMDSGETQWTQSINAQVDKMNDLISKMVFLSRMDEESTKQNRTDISLSSLLKELSENFAPLYQQKNIAYEASIKDELKIHADYGTMTELFNIFFENAGKYTSKDGWLKLQAERKGKQAVITFSNSIDYEFGKNPNLLFERFYRTDASRNSETGGSGLGLSIAKSIIESENGKLKAEVVSKDHILFDIRLNLIA